MTLGTDFRVHLLEHRNVVFQDHDAHKIIIAGIFLVKMDIPLCSRALAMMTYNEIEAIRK